MSDYHEELANAGAPSAIYERLAFQVRNCLPVSGINVMPFAPAPDGSTHSVLYLRDGDAEEFRGPVVRAVQALQAEPGLPDLFRQPQRALRVEEVFGWKRWLQSSVYQDHFLAMRSARQLVVGLADSSGRPRAIMAVCRSADDDVISVQEEQLVLGLRNEAERALDAFDLETDWSRPVASILDDLTAALPVPTFLMNARHILWMNHEAELRLGAVALSFGSDSFYLRGTPAVEELVAFVRAELDQPGTSLKARSAQSAFKWLLPNESIVVRRIERNGCPVSALACLCAVAPSPAPSPDIHELKRAYHLTAREASIVLLAIEGYSVLSIANHLNVAQSTVCTHLKRIYSKLGVRSRAELAFRILRSA